MQEPLGPVLGVTDHSPTGTVNEGGFLYAWFDPLGELALKIGTQDPVFQFWCELCGDCSKCGEGGSGPTLINISSLAAAPAPSYDCFTALGIANSGICTLLTGWMLSLFYHRMTGLPERPQCS
jgi:hypothetical protein